MEYINTVTLWGTVGGSVNFSLFEPKYIKIVVAMFFVEEILRLLSCLLIGTLRCYKVRESIMGSFIWIA